jgi:PAS domain S-box-containing protein
MSSVELSTLDGPEKTPSAPVGMVSHLKHLIESLPVCVMRTDLNGCLLAANDSALQLLGVTEHAKVLTKSLSERVSAEHTDDWRAFLQRTWTEGAGSVECELIDFNGAHRIILVKSVAQPTHVDGIQSLILTAQDLASRRRLERALNEHQGCATAIDALQAELQKSDAERQRLAALLETSETQPDRASEDEAAVAGLKRQIEELQATLASKEKEWQERTDEHLRQMELGAEREAEQRALSDALQERLTDLERSVVAKDAEWQRRCDDLNAQLAGHAAEREKLATTALEAHTAEEQRLATLVEQRTGEHQQLANLQEQREAEHKAASEALQQRIDQLEHSLKAAEQDWQRRSDDLTATIAEHAAARRQLTNALAQLETDHRTAGDSLRQQVDELQRSLKASEQTLKGSEEQWQKRCDELTAHLAEVSAEREYLAKLLEQRNTDHRTAGSTLHRRIEELERTLKASGEAWQKQRAALSAELVTHLTEQERLSAVLKQREDEYQQLSLSLKQREEDHQRLSEALKQREAEYQRLSDLLNQRDAECHQVSGALKQREEEYQRLLESLKQHDGEHSQQSDFLKQLEQERQQLSDSLQQQERERQQLTDSLKRQERERQELSELMRRQESERQQLAESLKQSEIEQQKLTELLKRRDAEHALTVEGFHQQIVEFERALAASDESWKARCEELSAELTATDQERTRRWEELTTQLVEHAAERQRLSHEVEQSDAERQWLIERHETEKVRIEQSVRGECERIQMLVEEARRLEIDGLRHDIRQLVDDLQGTAAQLNQRSDDYDRLMKKLTAMGEPGEMRNLTDVERFLKSAAAYRIELVQVTENIIRTLEPMATAGRVAIASSRELQAAVEAVDVRSRELLEQCGLDDGNRPEIERLRRDSIALASLVRQLLQVFGETTRAAGQADEPATRQAS